MRTNLLSLIITLVIGVILTGALLAPVISDASKTTETFTNDGITTMNTLADGDVWQRDSTANTWTFNGDAITTPNNGSFVVVTNNTFVRDTGQIRGTTATGNPTDTKVTVGTTSLSLNGTGLNGTAPTYTGGYGATSEGSFVLSKYLANRTNDNLYVLGNGEIFGTDVIVVGTAMVMIHAEGTISEGVEVSAAAVYNQSITDLSITNEVVDVEAIDGYNNLYNFKEITYTVSGTVGDDTVTAEGSISCVVVDKEITAELSNHLSSAEIAIMAARPILVIVALVFIAARSVRD